MSPQYLHKDFAKQFRQDYILFLEADEYQYKNCLFRQFISNKGEIALLGEWVAEKFNNSGLIRQIIINLRNKDIADSRHLFNFVLKLNKILDVYIDVEPYTANYYNGVIAVLNSFCDLTNKLQADINNKICENLENHFWGSSKQNNFPDMDSKLVNEMVEVIDFFLTNIYPYYDHFNITLQYEVNNSGAIQIPTQMGDYLSKLITFTEQIIIDLELTREMLLGWEAEIDSTERQELYN